MRRGSLLALLVAIGLTLSGCFGIGSIGNLKGIVGDQQYAISGHVKDDNGDGVEGVTLSTDTGDTATTSSDGSWSISGLKGPVKITPAKKDWSFDPASESVTGARRNVDFAATAPFAPKAVKIVDIQDIGVVEAYDGKLFVAGADPIAAYDISDPVNPSELEKYSWGTNVFDMNANDGKVFIASFTTDWAAAQLDLDLSLEHDLTSDTRVDTVAAQNGLMFYTDNDCFRVGARDPYMHKVGNECSSNGYSYRDLSAEGDYVFAAGGGDSGGYGDLVSAFNVADPTNPIRHTYRFTDDSYPHSVLAKGDTLYVGRVDDFTIMDISTPSTPALVGNMPTPDWVESVAVRGDRAYLALRDDGLGIVDISDPTDPKLLQTLTSGDLGNGSDDRVMDVAVSADGRYVYAADFEQGLVIYQVAE